MILRYAQIVQSKRAAAKRFDIEPKQIRDWKKKGAIYNFSSIY